STGFGSLHQRENAVTDVTACQRVSFRVTHVVGVTPVASTATSRRCDHGCVTADTAPRTPTDWLTLPDLVELIGEPLGRVRRLLEDLHLIGSRRDGGFKVPSVFLIDGQPVPALRGTVFVLRDAGFD